MHPPSLTRLITLGLLVAGLVASDQSSDCGFDIQSFTGQKMRYIVLLKEESASTHYEWLKTCAQKNKPDPSTAVSSLSVDDLQDKIVDFSVKGSITGYSGYFDAKFIQTQMSKRTETLLIERDAPVSIKHPISRQVSATTVQKNPPEHLDRIDQADFPLDKKYTFPSSAGTGAVVYVVDTGVLVSHSEFEGRASFGGAFCTGCPNTDDQGHGSHVSGLVAGKTFGVAKKSKIIGIKVLDANGAGSNVDVINGLTFVLQDHKKKVSQKSVVNMSLGGTFSAAVNTAVKSLTDAGVHVVVAAGNEASDACKTSPASEKSAITVGALNNGNNTLASFSNFGKCLTLFSPGVNIQSVGIASNTDTAIFSGTSQATPQVAGTVALILGEESGNPTPAEMKQKLVDLATSNKIPNTNGSPNEILRVP